YIACGLAKKEIASVMHVSVKTVNMHTANIMAKLGIHNRVELTRLAIREGIIKP
ncbi:response regulator transcription factor, partial [Candidatus Sumerlaeota bacterium]|nr:response regulator transcription factor [Candidatus Sumerlaeota bacterium]